VREAVNNEYGSKIQKRVYHFNCYFRAVPVPEDAKEQMVTSFS